MHRCRGVVGPGGSYRGCVARLRLFAQAREAAGTKEWEYEAPTVGALLDAAVATLGPEFGRVLPHCRIWVDGEPADRATAIGDNQEVAVLPPVSGG